MEERIYQKILLEVKKIEIKTDLARMKITLCKRNTNIAFFVIYSSKKIRIKELGLLSNEGGML